MKTNIQVAIDGPASAGKSTIAKIIAKNLSYIYVDTGAMYRTITLAAINAGLINLDDDASEISDVAIQQLLQATQITFKPSDDGQLVFLNEQDVSEEIRQSHVNNLVSLIAAIPTVRRDLVERQRIIANENNVIMDGRDIGTTVLPHAAVKIFLVASVAERAQRRYRENQLKGIDTKITLAEIEASIERRDYLDSHREVSPLTQATDAILVDTTGVTINDVVNEITTIINNKIK